jgi:ribosome-binding protein aMBF1 (putative translation factor)
MQTLTFVVAGEEWIAVRKGDFARLVDEPTPKEAALGKRLRAARLASGLTQADIARRMRRTQATVSRIESGRVRPSRRYVERVLALCARR